MINWLTGEVSNCSSGYHSVLGQAILTFTQTLEVTYSGKIPLFLFLGEYIRVSEVTNKCKTPPKKVRTTLFMVKDLVQSVGIYSKRPGTRRARIPLLFTSELF